MTSGHVDQPRAAIESGIAKPAAAAADIRYNLNCSELSSCRSSDINNYVVAELLFLFSPAIQLASDLAIQLSVAA